MGIIKLFQLFILLFLASCSTGVVESSPTAPLPEAKSEVGMVLAMREVEKKLMVVTESGAVFSKTSQLANVPVAHFPQAIQFADISPDAQWAAGVSETTLVLISLSSNSPPLFYRDLKSRVRSIAFDRSSNALLIAGADGRVYRWKFLSDSTTLRPNFERYAGHGSVVGAVTSDFDTPVFFSADWLGVLSAWLPYDADRFAGEFDKNVFGTKVFTDRGRVRVNADRPAPAPPIDFLTATPDFLFAGTQSGGVEQWQIRGFKLRGSVVAHPSTLVSMDVSPDNFIVTAGRDGTVRIWDGRVQGVIILLKEESFERVTKVALGSSTVWIALKTGELQRVPFTK